MQKNATRKALNNDMHKLLGDDVFSKYQQVHRQQAQNLHTLRKDTVAPKRSPALATAPAPAATSSSSSKKGTHKKKSSSSSACVRLPDSNGGGETVTACDERLTTADVACVSRPVSQVRRAKSLRAMDASTMKVEAARCKHAR